MDLIPLRADPAAMIEKRRQSFCRAATALFMAHRTNARAYSTFRANWPDDTDCDKILKAASSPSASADFPQVQAQKILPMLSPDSASSRLLNLANKLDLAGIYSIRIPTIGFQGRPASVAFVGEGNVMPVVDLATGATILGPTHKLTVGVSLTREMQDGSADNAADILSQALAISAEQSVDMALFSANASTATAPAGLLYGVTPVASAAGTGATGCAADVGNLAKAIGDKGVNSDSMVIIATPKLATQIRFFEGPHHDNRVISSAYLAAGTIVGIVPEGLAVGYDGAAKIEISNVAVYHAEDTAPLPIGQPGSPPVVAAPTISALQQDLLVLKIRARVAWAIQPNAIATVTGCAW
jgi:hypothetical protein